jgi:hypothetical protein
MVHAAQQGIPHGKLDGVQDPPESSVDPERRPGPLIDLASELEDDQRFVAALSLLRALGAEDDLDALVIDLMNHAL